MLDKKNKSNKDNIVNHIAVIPDGNGRWAAMRNMPRSYGHKKGVKAIEEAVKACLSQNIKYLTIYGFSAENWLRPQEEVTSLMELLRKYLSSEVDNFNDQSVKVKILGNLEDLDKDIIDKIKNIEKLTQNNNKLQLNIGLSYGGRQEIVRACNKIINNYPDLKMINMDIIEQNLYTHQIPDPDLLIRTGGEKRLSNFLLWQMAYTELIFTDILWPDFTQNDIIAAINEYKKRERRYGT